MGWRLLPLTLPLVILMTYDEGNGRDELYRFTTVEIAYSGTRQHRTSFALECLLSTPSLL